MRESHANALLLTARRGFLSSKVASHEICSATFRLRRVRVSTRPAPCPKRNGAASPRLSLPSTPRSRSVRFQPIPTIEVLRRPRKGRFHAGWREAIDDADESKREHTKHLIRSAVKERAIQRWRYRLRNASQKRQRWHISYDLMAGLFRIACLNSLVSKDVDAGLRQGPSQWRCASEGNRGHVSRSRRGTEDACGAGGLERRHA